MRVAKPYDEWRAYQREYEADGKGNDNIEVVDSHAFIPYYLYNL